MDESRKEKILKAAEEEASCESISAGGKRRLMYSVTPSEMDPMDPYAAVRVRPMTNEEQSKFIGVDLASGESKTVEYFVKTDGTKVEVLPPFVQLKSIPLSKFNWVDMTTGETRFSPEKKKEPKFPGWVLINDTYYLRASLVSTVTPSLTRDDHCLITIGKNGENFTVRQSAEEFLKLLVEAEKE